MSALVETMMYAKDGGIPWHGMGTEVDGAPDSKTAIGAAGLDWNVAKYPVYALIDGKYIEIPDRFANVRLSDASILGVVSKDFVNLQNDSAFEILDRVIGELGLQVVYETAGALRDGKEVFLTARIPREIKIGSGDVQYPFLMLKTGHDGSTAFDIVPTFIRPVCWNTITAAMMSRGSDEYFGLSMWHTGDVDEKVNEAKAALNLSLREMDVYESVMNQLEAVAVTDAMLAEFTANVVPDIFIAADNQRLKQAILPAPDSHRYIQFVSAEQFDKAMKGREQRVEAFMTCYREEKPNAYGLFNAATGYADHTRPRMWKDPANRLNTIMFGNGHVIKKRAFKAITEMAGVEVKLPERPKTAHELKAEGLSNAEIAARLGVNVSTVGRRLKEVTA